MNKIPESVYQNAKNRFFDGASIRQVMGEFGIARETAHRIQKMSKIAGVKWNGVVRINTGKRRDGTISFYETRECRDHWDRQQYAKASDLDRVMRMVDQYKHLIPRSLD